MSEHLKAVWHPMKERPNVPLLEHEGFILSGEITFIDSEDDRPETRRSLRELMQKSFSYACKLLGATPFRKKIGNSS